MNRESSEQLQSALRLFLETSLDAVVVMGSDGRVVNWNDHAATTFGWSREEAVGQTLAELVIPHRYRDAHAKGLEIFLRTGEGPVLQKRIEISGLRKSGEEFPVELTISPVQNGNSWTFVGSIRDLTESKRAEHFRAQQAIKMDVLYRVVSYASERHSFEDALQLCLESVQRLTGWPAGHVYLPTDQEPVVLVPSGIWHFAEPEKYVVLREVTANTYLEPGRGLPGRIWESAAPVWIPDINADPNVPRARPRDIGVRAAFGFPIKVHDRIIAILEFFSDVPSEPDPDLMITLRTIGDQVGRVFERRQAEQALREQAEALERAYQEAQTQVAELQKAEEHQRLLMAELNHRVKNMLTVVTGIASQTARSSRSITAFNENFMARIGALAKAHTLLTERNWAPTPLQRLMEELVGPYAQPEEGHLEVKGPPVSLPPKASLAVSMILHELITNAAKYGALSVSDGRIFVEWSVSSEADRLIRLTWRETGMQGLSRPRRTGFGTRMIEASVQHELGGRAEVTYRPEGIRYQFEFSANQ